MVIHIFLLQLALTPPPGVLKCSHLHISLLGEYGGIHGCISPRIKSGVGPQLLKVILLPINTHLLKLYSQV
jgi:hypothetical protein